MKKIKKFSLIASLVFLLTSCVRYELNFKVSKDGYFDFTMNLLVQESMLETAGMSKEETIEQLKTSFQESVLNEDPNTTIDISELEKEIDGVKYFGLIVKTDQQLVEQDKFDVQVKDDSVTLVIKSLDELSSMILGDGENESISQAKSFGIEMVLNIEMPGNITSSSFGDVKDNVVTIDLLDKIEG